MECVLQTVYVWWGRELFGHFSPIAKGIQWSLQIRWATDVNSSCSFAFEYCFCSCVLCSVLFNRSVVGDTLKASGKLHQAWTHSNCNTNYCSFGFQEGRGCIVHCMRLTQGCMGLPWKYWNACDMYLGDNSPTQSFLCQWKYRNAHVQSWFPEATCTTVLIQYMCLVLVSCTASQGFPAFPPCSNARVSAQEWMTKQWKKCR